MKVLVGPNNLALESVLDALRPRYPDITFAHCPDRAGLAAALADADVYLGWLSGEEFLAARRLRWIQSPSSGIDRFLAIPELAAGQVLLTSARGTHGACLAEHTFAMILAFTRRIREYVFAQGRHEWANRELRPAMRELTGATMGIIGLGAVGRAIARRAAAFDMRVVAVDAVPAEAPEGVAWLCGPDGLGRLLDEADYVVVTVPWTPETVGLIGAEELARLKPTAMLVGISRGGIIDEAALLAALREGRLAAAALDVTATEPLPADSPLWEEPNLLITPHVAGGTQYETAHILEIFTENLARLLRGELPLRNQIDKARGF
ncbi:MAG: D-2-hydroxyacid dehydrogenase [Chloroflexi bacterium]|nr:D-2-hydroxyacid dehydrogenase [Chloroflexota bacterium]